MEAKEKKGKCGEEQNHTGIEEEKR